MLTHVQNDLFDVGADFCTPVVENPEYPPLRIEADYVDRLEGWCDHYNEDLPKLRSFILNGGTVAAAHLHIARTVVPAGRALGLGGVRGVRRLDERPRDHLSQPALRPAVHPGALREPRERRRALGARRRARRVETPTGLPGNPDASGVACPNQVPRRPGRTLPRRPRPRWPGLEPRLQPGEGAGLIASSASPRGVWHITTTWPAYSANSSAPSGSRWETSLRSLRRQVRRGPGSGEKMRNHSSESSR